MAGSGKGLGPGTRGQGKGDGGGAMTNERPMRDNAVLSNRDKSIHSDQRGQDSKWIETQQRQDHEANKADDR